jgi:hypothetical protein
MDAADRRGVKPVDPEFVDTLGDFDALGLSSRPEFDRFLVLLLAAGGVHMLKFLVEEYEEEEEISSSSKVKNRFFCLYLDFPVLLLNFRPEFVCQV